MPYRNSRLTHFLQPCLGGNSKTLMLVNVSPAAQHLQETVLAWRPKTPREDGVPPVQFWKICNIVESWMRAKFWVAPHRKEYPRMERECRVQCLYSPRGSDCMIASTVCSSARCVLPQRCRRVMWARHSVLQGSSSNMGGGAVRRGSHQERGLSQPSAGAFDRN